MRIPTFQVQFAAESNERVHGRVRRVADKVDLPALNDLVDVREVAVVHRDILLERHIIDFQRVVEDGLQRTGLRRRNEVCLAALRVGPNTVRAAVDARQVASAGIEHLELENRGAVGGYGIEAEPHFRSRHGRERVGLLRAQAIALGAVVPLRAVPCLDAVRASPVEGFAHDRLHERLRFSEIHLDPLGALVSVRRIPAGRRIAVGRRAGSKPGEFVHELDADNRGYAAWLNMAAIAERTSASFPNSAELSGSRVVAMTLPPWS